MARKDADMTQGSIWPLLIRFAVPLAIGMLFQQLYNTVDMVVVGRYVGTEAQAAVGSVSSIVNMLVGLCSGLSLGAGVVISQAYGAHDNKRLHAAVHTTVSLTFILCAIATAVGLVIVHPMLHAMNTPPDVFGEASQYLSIYFAGISGLLVYNMGGSILRAVGDSRRPLYFLIFSAVLNTALDLLFVVALGKGVEGVAWATIIAQGASALLILATLTREKGAYGLRWRELHIEHDTFRQVLRVGWPSGIQQALTAFSNVFVQSYINAFDAAAMAGWGTYNKLDVFIIVPAMAIAQASTTFVGQNWGARQPARARQGARQSLMLSLSFTAVLAALMVIFARPMVSLFNPDPEVVDYGVRFVRIISPFYVAVCFNQIYSGALRGIGNARAPMLIMLGSFVVFRQVYLFTSTTLLAGASLGSRFVAVALAYPMGWILCSALATIVYRRSALFAPEVQEKNILDA